MGFGQANEDLKIIKRFFNDAKWKRPGAGFFVEMGGYDGISFSNTFLLEQCYGWHGLLIEAHPVFYQQMILSRPCAINVWGAVCNHTNSHAYMVHDFIQTSVNLTEIAEFNLMYPERPRRVRLVPCKNMKSILSEHSVTTIDFFSLDIEGYEAEVLDQIDYTHVTINVLIVEREFLGNKNVSHPEYVNGEAKMRKIHEILTKRAGMLLMPLGGQVPECTRQRLLLPKRVFELYGSALYVSPAMRDDICREERENTNK